MLRYDDFAAKARGIRAMLPFVDEFRPIHNLDSMAELCKALSGREGGAGDPKTWLRTVGVTCRAELSRRGLERGRHVLPLARRMAGTRIGGGR